MSGDFFGDIIVRGIATTVAACLLWFCRSLLTSSLRLIHSGIIHLRNKQAQLPEDGYHRPDNSDDLVAATPKKSLLDRLDGVLAKWNRMLDEAKK